MVEPVSPLGEGLRPGRYGNIGSGTGVRLRETRPASIVEARAWQGRENELLRAIRKATGLELPDGAGAGIVKPAKAGFGCGPGRFLLIDQAERLAERLAEAIDMETGTVTDLSHGRTAIRIAGPKAEWVLSKFFALDFALTAFPLGAGKAAQHHDILAQIQRTGEEQFDLYVFRSLARSFWKTLCHAAEEVGYEAAV
jgi:sarcosine oxidase subunit gamma